MIRLHGAYISTGYILKDKSACSTSSLTSVHVKEAINTKAVTPTSRSKRRTTAAQEERLQLALARLAQQESSSSDVKSQPQHQHPPEISVDKYYAVHRGRASNVIYTSWLGCKAQVHQ